MDAPSIFKDKAADDDRMEEEEEDFYDGEFLFKKKKLVFASGSGKKGSGPSCQAERCVADLSDEKRYLLRHRVCQFHAKASVVTVAGLRQRFCQQCSRFHELSEFDDKKEVAVSVWLGTTSGAGRICRNPMEKDPAAAKINLGKLTIEAKLK